jgi:hypothetical protein
MFGEVVSCNSRNVQPATCMLTPFHATQMISTPRRFGKTFSYAARESHCVLHRCLILSRMLAVLQCTVLALPSRLGARSSSSGELLNYSSTTSPSFNCCPVCSQSCPSSKPQDSRASRRVTRLNRTQTAMHTCSTLSMFPCSGSYALLAATRRSLSTLHPVALAPTFYY